MWWQSPSDSAVFRRSPHPGGLGLAALPERVNPFAARRIFGHGAAQAACATGRIGISLCARRAARAGQARRSAAPAGGASKEGRGCDTTPIATSLWPIAAALASAAAAPLAALPEQLSVPSGHTVELQELILDPDGMDGPLYRFRFVAPWIVEEATDFDAVAADMEYLCSEIALPALPVELPELERIVVSLGSAPSEFGVADRSVTQFFELFRVEEDRCIWEAF